MLDEHKWFSTSKPSNMVSICPQHSFICPKSMQQTFFSEPPDDAGCLTALHMPQDVWMCTSTTWCQHFFVCVGGMFCMNSDTNSAFCSMIEIL